MNEGQDCSRHYSQCPSLFRFLLAIWPGTGECISPTAISNDLVFKIAIPSDMLCIVVSGLFGAFVAAFKWFDLKKCSKWWIDILADELRCHHPQRVSASPDCLEKVEHRNTGEILYQKVHPSPRPPPRITLQVLDKTGHWSTEETCRGSVDTGVAHRTARLLAKATFSSVWFKATLSGLRTALLSLSCGLLRKMPLRASCSRLHTRCTLHKTVHHVRGPPLLLPLLRPTHDQQPLHGVNPVHNLG